MENSNLVPVTTNEKRAKKEVKLSYARTVSMVKKLDNHNIKIDFKKTLIDCKKYSDKIDFNNVADKNKESFDIAQIERAKKVLTKILKNKDNELSLFEIVCKECKSKKGYFNQYRILCKLNAVLKFGDKKENTKNTLSQNILLFHQTSK